LTILVLARKLKKDIYLGSSVTTGLRVRLSAADP